jgi:hypothetical protein
MGGRLRLFRTFFRLHGMMQGLRFLVALFNKGIYQVNTVV